MKGGEVGEALPLVEIATSICDSQLTSNESSNDTKQTERTPLQQCQTKLWACRIIIALTIGDGKTAFHYSQLRYKAAEDEFNSTGRLTPFMTATCNTLGQSYGMIRLYDKALYYLEKSVEYRKQMPKFQKDWLFSPYCNIGVILNSMGRSHEAADIIQTAIKDREEALGLNDRVSSRTGALYYVLGNIRRSQGAIDESFSLHQRAYLQCRLTAGESALATLRCMQKLAEHYEAYGDLAEAR